MIGQDSKLSPEVERRQRRRAVASSIIGTTIEWYDFFVYGTVAALVFPKLFFPGSDPYVALMQTFLTFAIGFLARPLGGMFFGHFGDRIGRKTTLIVTIVLMGAATTLMGLMPTYEHIGLWAAVLITLLRFLQGFSVGGEWAGAVILALEWSERPTRGLMASLPQMGVPFGLILSSAVVSLTIALTGDAFDAWGWRIPFLLSFILLVLGVWMRLSVMETPIFQQVLNTRRTARAPLLETFRRHPASLFFGLLANLQVFATFYIFNTYFVSYGATILQMPKNLFVNATLVGAIVLMLTIPIAGFLSDRVPRRSVVLFGYALTVVYAFPYFALVNTKSPGAIVLAAAIGLMLFGIFYGPMAAVNTESFPPALRYTGSSLIYQVAGATAGGFSPMIATYLLKTFGTTHAISAYIALVGVLSLIGTAVLKAVAEREMRWVGGETAGAEQPAE
ncbi:MAG: MHS family MFS transporter [Hydrogenibacillus schlegelii]|uniref:Putative proline/betaine transporter n=1 Tax=Hydrogenibacillus schlegelii TaxID=1484 RepID=A0A947CVX2_HYDSH|nr:MHS family MFS transporter [Hydrogenibacillus schlegelii]